MAEAAVAEAAVAEAAVAEAAEASEELAKDRPINNCRGLDRKLVHLPCWRVVYSVFLTAFAEEFAICRTWARIVSAYRAGEFSLGSVAAGARR